MVLSANVPPPGEAPAIKPNTSFDRASYLIDQLPAKLTLATYVYTFAPQEGVSGGDENASA